MLAYNYYLLNSNPPKVKTNAEDAVVSRAPELRQLSENIDKATNTWVNATLQLESAIRKYNSAQTTLGNAVEHLVDMYSLVPAYAKGSAVRKTCRWFICSVDTIFFGNEFCVQLILWTPIQQMYSLKIAKHRLKC